MYTRMMNSPIGCLFLRASDQGICEIRLFKEGESLPQNAQSPLLDEAERQLQAYFEGRRIAFELPFVLRGTAFERTVWEQLRTIPFGDTKTYGQSAQAIGQPAVARAVGAACGRNPLLIVIPCHRVVGSTGRLTGFAAGLEAKRTLLSLEGFELQGDRIKRYNQR